MASLSVNPTDFYSIGQESKQEAKRFNTVALAFPIDFHNMNNNADIGGTVYHALGSIIERGCQLHESEAKVGIRIYHHSEGLDKRILVPFCYKDQLTLEMILDLIEDDDEQIECRDIFRLDVQITSIEKPTKWFPLTTLNQRPSSGPHLWQNQKLHKQEMTSFLAQC
jgi:hypothetical protein